MARKCEMRRHGSQALLHRNDAKREICGANLESEDPDCEEGRGGAGERLWRGSTRGKYASWLRNNRVGTSVLDSMKLKLSIPEG